MRNLLRLLTAAALTVTLTACGSALVRETLQPYRLAVKADPQSPRAHYDLGAAALAVDRPKEARKCFRRCLELDPEYLEAHLKLATAEETLGNMFESNDCYKRALEIDPDCVEPKIGLAENYLGMAIYFEYLGSIPLIGASGDLSYLQVSQLDAWHMTRDDMVSAYGETLEFWKELVQVEPENPEFWANLGVIANLTMNFEGSMTAFNRVVQLDKEFFVERTMHRQVMDASGMGQRWIPTGDIPPGN